MWERKEKRNLCLSQKLLKITSRKGRLPPQSVTVTLTANTSVIKMEAQKQRNSFFNEYKKINPDIEPY